MWFRRPSALTQDASADYIHLYHGNAALLTESLEVIQKTAALILSALETEQAAADETAAPAAPATTNQAADAAHAEMA